MIIVSVRTFSMRNKGVLGELSDKESILTGSKENRDTDQKL